MARQNYDPNDPNTWGDDPTNDQTGGAGAPDAPAPGNDENAIHGYYSSFLGRPGTDKEVGDWAGQVSGGQHLGLGDIQNRIANSDEAKRYAASLNKKTDAGGGTPPPIPPPPPGPDHVTVPDQLPTDPAASGFNQSIRDLLLSQLQGDLSQPETADSPDIAPAIAANKLQSQRDEEAARDQLAESAYANNGGSGLQSGGFQTALARNRENMAANRANFVGGAVMNAAQNKRQALNQMLNTAVQFGDTQTAQQIQSQIALLDAKLQEQGLNQNWMQGNNNLAFNYAQLLAQQNKDALLAGLNG